MTCNTMHDAYNVKIVNPSGQNLWTNLQKNHKTEIITDNNNNAVK